jgi:hypothetical protein
MPSYDVLQLAHAKLIHEKLCLQSKEQRGCSPPHPSPAAPAPAAGLGGKNPEPLGPMRCNPKMPKPPPMTKTAADIEAVQKTDYRGQEEEYGVSGSVIIASGPPVPLT